ncbi:MAG: hypothetical protein ACI4R8_04900 [Candidatus Caccovivens sp.]
MENLYNDEMLPEDFEQIAKAYAHKMKDKGFVFIKLEDEERELLIGEIFVLIAKMKACLERLKKCLESDRLMCRLENAEEVLRERFSNKKPHKFNCVVKENDAFLSLISIENTLVIKLMLLSIKTEEYELCNSIITGITSIFAESFSQEGFIVELT